MQMLPTTFGETAGQNPEQFVQVGANRAVGCLLYAEVFQYRDAVCTRDASHRSTQQLGIDTAPLGIIVDWNVAQYVSNCVDAADVARQEFFVAQVLLH